VKTIGFATVLVELLAFVPVKIQTPHVPNGPLPHGGNGPESNRRR